MKFYYAVFLYGFALFSMFFGSGNLVFPVIVGRLNRSSWLLSFFGLFVTGILLPLLGVFVIKKYDGDEKKFFQTAGTYVERFFPFFALSLMGSFGVAPRCISVAYGGFHTLFPNISLLLFSVIFSVFIFILCIHQGKIIKILGQWLTPFLLGSLILIIIAGVMHAPNIIALNANSCTFTSAFLSGFQEGYFTMDLVASLFFSSFILKKIKEEKGINDTVLLPAALVAGLLLSIIYAGFVFLGASFSDAIRGVNPEYMITKIAHLSLGSIASCALAIAVVLSCLTTAVVLNDIYALYIFNLLQIPRIYFNQVLGFVVTISCLVSLLNFNGIAIFLGPILYVSYPSIIALTMLNLATDGNAILKKSIFYSLLILSMLRYWFF